MADLGMIKEIGPRRQSPAGKLKGREMAEPKPARPAPTLHPQPPHRSSLTPAVSISVLPIPPSQAQQVVITAVLVKPRGS